MDGDWFDRPRHALKEFCFSDSPDQPAEDRECDDNTAPIKAARFLLIVPRKKNRKDDQDGDRADVNENLNEPDELGAEQKEKRGDSKKHDRETQRGVH